MKKVEKISFEGIENSILTNSGTISEAENSPHAAATVSRRMQSAILRQHDKINLLREQTFGYRCNTIRYITL